MVLDFIAFDVETANSAGHPCSISLVVVKDGRIAEEKEFLINPESGFSPINTRIHGICSDDVKNSPNFATAWSEIRPYFSFLPVVAHNISFDMNIINKAISRYQLSVPSCKCFCTMETAKRTLSLDSYKLTNVCNFFGISLQNHHDSLNDARACAEIAIKFLESGQTLYEVIAAEHKEYDVNDFERSILLNLQQIVGEPIRFSKRKNLCVYTCFWSFISIGKIKKGYYIPTSRDISFCSDKLNCDSVSAGNRIFLNSPDDLFIIKDFITEKHNDAKSMWQQYVSSVSESTVRKRVREYEKECCKLK